MKEILTLVATIFLLMSCNNNPGADKRKPKSAVDSVEEEVMDGHNKAMAKVARLHETKNKIQQVLDSLSRLPSDAQKRSAPYKMQLDSTLRRLNFADYAMDKWMNEFNLDSESNDADKRIKYLESEKIKISKVKDAIISSLRTADSLLNQPK